MAESCEKGHELLFHSDCRLLTNDSVPMEFIDHTGVVMTHWTYAKTYLTGKSVVLLILMGFLSLSR